MKVLLASASAVALMFLAACNGDAPPPPGGQAMEQNAPLDTAPTDDATGALQ